MRAGNWRAPFGAILAAGLFFGTASVGAEGPRKLGNFLDDYDLPGECQGFLANQKAVHAKIWSYSENGLFLDWRALCAQRNLAERSARTAEHDYVSKLDFGELRLDEIPYIDCEIGAVSRSYEAWCKDLDRKFPTLSQAHFLILWELFPKPLDYPEATPEHIAAARAVPIDRESCRLARDDIGDRQAVYTDRNLVLRDGRAVCVKVPYDELYPGFAFDTSETLFRDVDGDGYMDALLLIGNEGGGGVGSVTALVVVTKKQPGPGPLTKVRFQRLWE